ncbi:MAG: hypothetical protein AAB268_12525 [Elusimicrobiota bacterium]
MRSALGKAALEGARGLGNMLNGHVSPETWGMLRVPFNQPPIGLFTSEQNVYSVFMSMQGDLYGTAALSFSVPNAEKFMDRVLKQLGIPPPGNLKDFMGSAMEEAGNILVNGVMAELSKALRMEIYPSVPRIEQGPWLTSWSKLMLAQGVSGSGVVMFVDFSWELVPKFGQFILALSPDSLENVRLWALRGKAMTVSVGIGALETVSAPMVLKATDLGSCVVVAMYDAHQKKGGMAHVLLPKCPSEDSGIARPGKYADTAVTALLKTMRSKTKVSSWLVGGADMIMPQGSILSGTIGARNAEVLRVELKRNGVRLSGEDLGGSQARSVELLTETGELWIKWKQTRRREVM